MRFYVATSLSNAEKAARVRDLLVKLGHSITFDWMEASPVHPDDPRCKGKWDSNDDPEMLMAQRAHDDAFGVTRADALIVILPAKYGSHVELGIAIGSRFTVVAIQNARNGFVSDFVAPHIFLWAEGGLDKAHDSYPSVFHRLASVELVTGDLADLVSTVETWDKARGKKVVRDG